MDALTANTAGIDAAKGKTLEEMSDLVGQVSINASMNKNIFNTVTGQFCYLNTTIFLLLVNYENRRKKSTSGSYHKRIAPITSTVSRHAS